MADEASAAPMPEQPEPEQPEPEQPEPEPEQPQAEATAVDVGALEVLIARAQTEIDELQAKIDEPPPDDEDAEGRAAREDWARGQRAKLDELKAKQQAANAELAAAAAASERQPEAEAEAGPRKPEEMTEEELGTELEELQSRLAALEVEVAAARAEVDEPQLSTEPAEGETAEQNELRSRKADLEQMEAQLSALQERKEILETELQDKKQAEEDAFFEPQDDLEPAPPRPEVLCRCATTPPAVLGLAQLLLNTGGGDRDEKLLFYYRSKAVRWSVELIKGQLEALGQLYKDLTKDHSLANLSADFRMRGGDWGEDRVRAVFCPIGPYLAVFLFTTNVIDPHISEAAIKVLQSTSPPSVNQDDVEYGGLMPADVVPRPVTARDANLLKAVRDDSEKILTADGGLEAANDDHAASFVDEDFRTLHQIALEEGRTRTAAILADHSEQSAHRLPTSIHDVRGTNTIARARTLPGPELLKQLADQFVLLVETHYGKKRLHKIIGERVTALKAAESLLPGQRLCDMVWGELDAAEQMAADTMRAAAEKAAARRGSNASMASSVRSEASSKSAGKSTAIAGVGGHVGRDFASTLDWLSTQCLEAEQPKAALAPPFLPESIGAVTLSETLACQLNMVLTKLLVDKRAEAANYSFENRPAESTGVAYFAGGRLVGSVGLQQTDLRAIKLWCGRYGWFSRPDGDPECVRIPGMPAHPGALGFEAGNDWRQYAGTASASGGAFPRRVQLQWDDCGLSDQMVLVARRTSLLVLVLELAPGSAAQARGLGYGNGLYDPFYASAMRDLLDEMYSTGLWKAIEDERASSAKFPPSILDAPRNDDGVMPNRLQRAAPSDRVRHRVPITIPVLTAGGQNVLLFAISHDCWSGTVVVRPEGLAAARANSWKAELRREFYNAASVISTTLRRCRALGNRFHLAQEAKNKSAKDKNPKPDGVPGWPGYNANTYVDYKLPSEGGWPAKMQAGDSPSSGAGSYSSRCNVHRQLASVAEFGMRIRLPGAGDRRWSQVVQAADAAESGAGRGSSGLPRDGGTKRTTGGSAGAARTYTNVKPGMDDEWPLDFMVVGYLLPVDQGKGSPSQEVYVAYQSSIPQHVAELAFKMAANSTQVLVG